MNWIFLPDKRKRSFKNTDELIKTRFPRRARNTLRSLSKFNRMITGLFMIWFAVEVGFLITVSLSSFGSFSALNYVDGVKLPESKNRSTEFSRWDATYFVIDKHGVLEMNGEKIPDVNPVEFISKSLLYVPRSHAVIVANKDTPMWKISSLISQIKKAGFTRVLFSTDSQKIKPVE